MYYCVRPDARRVVRLRAGARVTRSYPQSWYGFHPGHIGCEFKMYDCQGGSHEELCRKNQLDDAMARCCAP